ncbi:MAG: hypothetical protein NTV43_01115 [Methylococcales bacterium]|nr:hypothetical protein [Methylococcales bacterium]
MNRFNKHLPLALIFSTATALTGCIIDGSGSSQHANKNYQYTPNKINLSLLHNISESEADQRLSAKGFRQVRMNEPGNTKWLNSSTNQCVEVLSNGDNWVSSVAERNLQFCNENSGYNNQNSGYNNQNSGYNNGNQPIPGQTPPALNDFVGSKAGQAEGDLVRRGYVLRKSAGLVSYWEETATGGCVSIVTNDGRYQSLVYVISSACR